MTNDFETAVTPNEETSQVSEQSADVQAHDNEPNALEEFMAESETENGDDYSQETETTESSEQNHESNSEEVVPKGIKGRILSAEAKGDKRGYERAQNEWATQKAEYERKIAAYEAKEAEAKLEEEAKELSRKEHISVEFAKRVLRSEQRSGIAPQSSEPEKVTTPSKTEQATLSTGRRLQLNSQADKIEQTMGINVLDFVTDQDADAIFKGTMDLWEVAVRSQKANETAVRRNAPTPVRSGGNPSSKGGGLDFSTMSDEEFDRFNSKIARGAVFKPR